jgi:hypothetical protein
VPTVPPIGSCTGSPLANVAASRSQPSRWYGRRSSWRRRSRRAPTAPRGRRADRRRCRRAARRTLAVVGGIVGWWRRRRRRGTPAGRSARRVTLGPEGADRVGSTVAVDVGRAVDLLGVAGPGKIFGHAAAGVVSGRSCSWSTTPAMSSSSAVGDRALERGGVLAGAARQDDERHTPSAARTMRLLPSPSLRPLLIVGTVGATGRGCGSRP